MRRDGRTERKKRILKAITFQGNYSEHRFTEDAYVLYVQPKVCMVFFRRILKNICTWWQNVGPAVWNQLICSG
jgi:hypothetical protein